MNRPNEGILGAVERLGAADARDLLLHVFQKLSRSGIARNAGVDTANQDALAESISRLVEEGATVVVVLHELVPLAPLITRTVVIHDGIIGYDGPPLRTAPDGHVSTGHHHHARAATPRPVPPLQAPLDGRTP